MVGPEVEEEKKRLPLLLGGVYFVVIIIRFSHFAPTLSLPIPPTPSAGCCAKKWITMGRSIWRSEDQCRWRDALSLCSAGSCPGRQRRRRIPLLRITPLRRQGRLWRRRSRSGGWDTELRNCVTGNNCLEDKECVGGNGKDEWRIVEWQWQ